MAIGQIIKKGKKRYQVRIPAGKDSKGKRLFWTKTITGTQADAEKLRTEKLRERDLGHLILADSLTLNAHLDRWFRAVVKGKVRARTFYSYNQLMNRYVRPKFGAKKLSQLEASEIQDFYSHLLGTLKPGVIRNIHNTLNSALKQAVKWRLLIQAPTALCEPPKLVKREIQTFTRAEAKRFLEAARGERLEAVYYFALATGMRPCEYLALRWSDVDLEGCKAYVRRNLYYRAREWDFTETKTSGSRRQVSFPSPIARKLKEHHRRQLEEKMKAGQYWQNLDLVFCTPLGAPLNPSNDVRLTFKRLLAKAEMPTSFRQYDQRHTCATLLLQDNEHIKVVSERLGHASTRITLDTYQQVTQTMQQGASDKIGEILFGEK